MAESNAKNLFEVLLFSQDERFHQWLNCFAFLFEIDAYAIFNDYAKIRQIVDTTSREIFIPYSKDIIFISENDTAIWPVLEEEKNFKIRCGDISCYQYSIDNNGFCNKPYDSSKPSLFHHLFPSRIFDVNYLGHI